MRQKISDQLDRLYELEDNGTCFTNEWYSVGLEPPREDVLKLKAIRRKITRMEKQLGAAA